MEPKTKSAVGFGGQHITKIIIENMNHLSLSPLSFSIIAHNKHFFKNREFIFTGDFLILCL